jgi:hypothetical protein
MLDPPADSCEHHKATTATQAPVPSDWRNPGPLKLASDIQLASDLPLPCDQDGEEGRWTTTADTPLRLGAGAYLYLTRKPDDTGSFSYTGVFRDGAVVISFVVNTSSSDRPTLDRLMTITWEQATQHR